MSRAWIAFYMGDYQKKTQHLTTEQHGAYFLLLQHCWTNGCIPAEPASRAAIARVPMAQWKRMAPVINAFFLEDGTNKRASEEIAKAEIISTKRALAGQRGGFRSGITKAIAKHAPSKRVANAQQTSQQTPQQKQSICVATHNHIVKSSSEQDPGGSLATAPPEGALRSPPDSGEGGLRPVSALSRIELEATFAKRTA